MDVTERPPDAPVLEAYELYRFYHVGDSETVALRGVTLSVGPGEMVAVVGPSGSGKSTLLSILAGLDEPDGGWVDVAGERITRRPERIRASLRARAIGVLLQAGNLVDHLTVADHVRLAALLAHRARPDVGRLLAQVGLDRRVARARPTSLSGGEAARAALAVALANDPPVILADEPTAEVDAENEALILGLFRSAVERGAAVVVATHSARLAAAADRVCVLEDGRLRP